MDKILNFIILMLKIVSVIIIVTITQNTVTRTSYCCMLRIVKPGAQHMDGKGSEGDYAILSVLYLQMYPYPYITYVWVWVHL
jgi:hypothetical protein